jgi:hypothetical protein
MRSPLIAALIGVSLLPAAALAQSAPQTTIPQQTAAIDAAAPASSAASAAGGLTRDQFVQRAKDRAAQRAAARFDQMDADHDGVLDRAEIRAWRNQHPRRAAAPASRPVPQ